MEGKNKINKIIFINSVSPRYELYRSEKIRKLFNDIVQKQGSYPRPLGVDYMPIFKKIFKDPFLTKEQKYTRIYEFIRNFLNTDHWQYDLYTVIFKLEGFDLIDYKYFKIGIYRIELNHWEGSYIKGNKINIHTGGDFLVNLGLLNTVKRLRPILNTIHTAIYEQFFNPDNKGILTTSQLEQLWLDCVSNFTLWDMFRMKYFHEALSKKWDLYEFYNGIFRRIFIENFQPNYETPNAYTMNSCFDFGKYKIKTWLGESFALKSSGMFKIGGGSSHRETFEVLRQIFSEEQLREFTYTKFFRIYS